MKEEEIPEELTDGVDRLMEIKDVKFKDLRRNDLEAIAFFDIRRVPPGAGDDWDFCHETLRVFHNPLVNHSREFKPLNPNEQGQFLQTSPIRMVTSILLDINREIYLVAPSPEEASKSKGEIEAVKRYYWQIWRDKYYETKVTETTPVVPIYKVNPDYEKIRKFVLRERGREEKGG